MFYEVITAQIENSFKSLVVCSVFFFPFFMFYEVITAQIENSFKSLVVCSV